MAKFIVKNTTILHNETSYGVGEEIELTDKIQIAKLADYITPVAVTKVTSASTADNGSKPASKQSADSTAITTTAKTTKSNKKADITVTSTEDTTAPTEEAKTETTKEEVKNGTETI